MVWPIEDDEQTQGALQEVAEADLPDMLFAAAMTRISPITWSVEPLEGNDLYLVAVFEVAEWVDPVRASRRKAVTA